MTYDARETIQLSKNSWMHQGKPCDSEKQPEITTRVWDLSAASGRETQGALEGVGWGKGSGHIEAGAKDADGGS